MGNSETKRGKMKLLPCSQGSNQAGMYTGKGTEYFSHSKYAATSHLVRHLGYVDLDFVTYTILMDRR